MNAPQKTFASQADSAALQQALQLAREGVAPEPKGAAVAPRETP